MKIVFVCEGKSIINNKVFLSRMEEINDYEITCLNIEKIGLNNLFGKIKELSPDILISTDLSGFEQLTLTDNISYNLLDCKQIHLLLHENLKNEALLKKQLSIAMFFYCTKDEYYKYLTKTYTNLPYIQKIPVWDKGNDEVGWSNNADAVNSIIDDVLIKCKLGVR